MEALAGSRDQLSLFGLDLRTEWDAYCAGLAGALRHRSLTWLVPDEVVALRTVDGRVQLRLGRAPESSARGGTARARAVELPLDLVLAQELRLPPLLARDLESAVRLRIADLSPFDEQDTVWGWISQSDADGGLRVSLAIASRRQIETYLAGVGEVQADVELWFDAARPIVMRGFGEHQRQRRRRRRGLVVSMLLLLMLGLLIGLVTVPVLHARQRAAEAAAAYARIERQAQPLLAKRERLTHLREGLEALARVEQEYVPPLPVLERLTRAIPDSAMVTRFSMGNGKISIAGVADDAAALLSKLGQSEGFFDVRSPSPIQRNARTGKETFIIELNLAEEPPKP